MSVLLMRLAGPMQAWGTQSRFSLRETGLEPSKSGVVGLLCAALGKPRDETRRPELPSLADLAALTMAVRIDRPGTMMRDYHTAQNVLQASSVPGRKPKLKTTELSERYYLADADFLVALAGDDTLLRRIEQALQHPVWPLYLGRRAFPPAAPVRHPAGVLDTNDPLAVLRDQPWLARRPGETPPGPLRISADAHQGETRHDTPRSFVSSQRSFSPRQVRDVAFVEVTQDQIEVEPCLSAS
jgi:CRISPR system Cascade subunit CasD